MRRFLGKPVAPVFFWILLASPGLLTAQERSYEEMRAEVGGLYGEERFAEAAVILGEALELYPDHMMANCVNLALMNLRLGQLDQSLNALSYGLDHGIWFGKYTFLDPARRYPLFLALHGGGENVELFMPNWTSPVLRRRMVAIMEEVGLAHEFHITPDVGHWYPDDLAERIDRAIAHIRGGGDQDSTDPFPRNCSGPPGSGCWGM